MGKSSHGYKYIHFLPASIFLIVCTSIVFAQSTKMDTNVPYGWCIVEEAIRGEEQVGSLTGGNNGRIVRSSSRADFDYLCQSEEPLVILAADAEYGTVALASNKTLVGDVRIGGGPGSSARTVSVGSNNIIRNFNIGGGTDGIGISGKSHIWIDHCTFYKSSDGQLDITNGSDKISVTWCKFTDGHNKTMLINNGKKNDAEKTKNNVTISHCFFDGTVQRNPRAGYGMIHILNSYYKSCQSYGVHVYWGARATIDRCNFVDTKDAVSHHGAAGGDGHIFYIDSKFDAVSKYAPAETNPDKIFTPSDYYLYNWTVIDADKVPEIVGQRSGVGAEFSKVGMLPTPAQGQVNVSTNPTLTWTKAGSNSTNKVYFGKTFPPQEFKTVSETSFKPGNLDGGTVYYWSVNDNDVWTFRTEGAIVATKPAITSNKKVTTPAKYQKGFHDRSSLFVGIEKNGRDKKVYNLNGKVLKNSSSMKNKTFSEIAK